MQYVICISICIIHIYILFKTNVEISSPFQPRLLSSLCFPLLQPAPCKEAAEHKPWRFPLGHQCIGKEMPPLKKKKHRWY